MAQTTLQRSQTPGLPPDADLRLWAENSGAAKPGNSQGGVRPLRKIGNIQALRAIAAICVAYGHTQFSLLGLQPFGAFGVHIFFVISGFIMAMIVAGGASEFFRRRLIRILPLYWSATLLVFAVSLAAPAVLRSTRPDVIQLTKSLLFIPFRKESGLIQPTLFLGWTLNYEMFFYALIGISLVVKRSQALILASTLIIATIVFCSFSGSDVIREFYGNPRSLEFIAGILTYRLYSLVSGISVRNLWPVLGIAALTAFLAMVRWEALDTVMTQWEIALKFGGAAFILVLSVALLSRASFDTAWRPVIVVGDASYVLYLIHPYIQYTLEKIVGVRVPMLSWHHVMGMLLAIAVPTGLSVLIHVKLERPFTGFLSRVFLRRPRSIEATNAVAAG